MYVVRNALLVVLLVATAACGAYRFPGPAGGTGTVSGQVIVYPCGPVQPVNQKCIPGPPAADCMPENPTCGGYPMPGVELTFTNGDATHGIKSTASGYYSIQLPAGTWTRTTWWIRGSEPRPDASRRVRHQGPPTLWGDDWEHSAAYWSPRRPRNPAC